MRQVPLLILLIAFSVSCSNSNDIYKQTLLDYLQIENELKTDLKIKIFLLDVLPDITVADSIKMLQEQYQNEKREKIDSAKKNISHWENTIEKQMKKDNDLIVRALVPGSQERLREAKTELEKAEQWDPDYLNLYNGRSPSEILAKKINASFSFQNPTLTVRQEISAVFVLSPDGRNCYKMVNRESFPYQISLSI